VQTYSPSRLSKGLVDFPSCYIFGVIFKLWLDIIPPMSIWLLALIMLVCGALAGASFGGIRAAFALLGIIAGAILSKTLSPLTAKLLSVLGIQNYVLSVALPSVIAFIAVLILFKIIGNFVAWKVEIYYKYKASELRHALWQRLNKRLGICLGMLNAAIYFILIMAYLYPFAYFTIQVSAGERDGFLIRVLNKLGKDAAATKVYTLTSACIRLPNEFYKVCDLMGMLYATPALVERLGHYPAILNFIEKPEVQDILSDSSFTNLILHQSPLRDIISHNRTRSILQNKTLLTETWQTISPYLDDLREYLETGISPKFKNEPILGKWILDAKATFAMLRRNLTNVTSRELRMIRELFMPMLEGTRLIATPDKKARLYMNFNPAILEQLISRQLGISRTRTPIALQPAPSEKNVFITFQGRWQKDDRQYKLNLSAEGAQLSLYAEVDGNKLVLAEKNDPMPLIMIKR